MYSPGTPWAPGTWAGLSLVPLSALSLSSVSLSLCLCLVLLTLPRHAAGTPFNPEDSYRPICGGLPKATPDGGWKAWSKSSTWGGAPVPGVGSTAGANVTIPCNVSNWQCFTVLHITVVR